MAMSFRSLRFNTSSRTITRVSSTSSGRLSVRDLLGEPTATANASTRCSRSSSRSTLARASRCSGTGRSSAENWACSRLGTSAAIFSSGRYTGNIFYDPGQSAGAAANSILGELAAQPARPAQPRLFSSITFDQIHLQTKALSLTAAKPHVRARCRRKAHRGPEFRYRCGSVDSVSLTGSAGWSKSMARDRR